MKFHYKALDQKGNPIEGTAEAENKFELSDTLKGEELTLLFAEDASKKSVNNFWRKLSEFGTVSMHERIVFVRNVGSMLEAGLPLSRALGVMERQTKNKKHIKIIIDIADSIKKGTSFSDALSKYPKVYSKLLISMVKAGEESGNLVNALDVVATQMEKSYELKRKVKGALIYPGVIISAMIIIAIFMMIFVVPTLTEVFNDLEVELPATTKFVIATSQFMENNITATFLILIVLIAGIYFALKQKKVKYYINLILLYTPVISKIIKAINSARTSRTLSSLLTAGVPYVQSLQITGDVIQNEHFKAIIKKAEKSVELGMPVSTVFEEAEKLYPPFVSEMIAVGEETGELGPMLLKVSTFYEKEVEQKTKNMSTIIEPVLMIVVGVAVGFFAVSMITPMYSLVEGF